MLSTPLAAALSRDAVAHAMIGSHANDPVLPDPVDRKASARAPRMRNLVAALLRRAAEAVAVPERRPAC